MSAAGAGVFRAVYPLIAADMAFQVSRRVQAQVSPWISVTLAFLILRVSRVQGFVFWPFMKKFQLSLHTQQAAEPPIAGGVVIRAPLQSDPGPSLASAAVPSFQCAAATFS